MKQFAIFTLLVRMFHHHIFRKHDSDTMEHKLRTFHLIKSAKKNKTMDEH